MNNIATSPELQLDAGMSAIDPAREFGLAGMAKINQKFALSAYDLARRHALLSNFADDINDRFVGKDNCPTSTAYEFSGRAWEEMEFIEQALGKTPPRNLHDVCGQIAIAIHVAYMQVHYGHKEKARIAAFELIEKIMLGALEIVAPLAGVQKSDIIGEYFVNSAEKEWGTKIVPETASPTSDVQLQALSNEFRRRYAECAAAPDDTDAGEAECERLAHAYIDVAEAMELMPAATLAGLAAKASIVKEHLMISESAYSGMAHSLAEDCLRLAGALGPDANPDAELIELCRQFDAAALRGGELPWDNLREILGRMIELRAQTRAGLEARVNTIQLWHGTFDWLTDLADRANWTNAMISTLVRDAIGHDPVPVVHDEELANKEAA